MKRKRKLIRPRTTPMWKIRARAWKRKRLAADIARNIKLAKLAQAKADTNS